MRFISKLFLAFAITGCGLAAHAEQTITPATAPATTSTTTSTTTTTTTTTVPPTTTTTLPPLTFIPKCPHIVDIARAVGWPDAELQMVDRIAFRESRCDIDWGTGQPRCAHNPTDPSGGSWGAMQINQSWVVKNRWNPHPAGFLGALGIANGPQDLCDWTINLRASKALYDYSLNRHGWDGRFRPWWPLPEN